MLGYKIIHFKALHLKATISLPNFSKFLRFGKEIKAEVS